MCAGLKINLWPHLPIVTGLRQYKGHKYFSNCNKTVKKKKKKIEVVKQ